MKINRADRLKLSEEAALWLLRLEGDVSPQCRSEFFAWVRQSPRNMEEFMFAKAVSAQLSHMDPQRKIEVDWSALATLGSSPDPVIELGSAGNRSIGQPHRTERTWLLGLAAGIAAIALSWILVSSVWRAEDIYSTSTGDQQSIKLHDGSLMQLNTHSRAAVAFSDTAREIRLLEGEALFVVAQDRARPFRVVTGSAVIEAIGTQFNVYRLPDTTRISVVEGVVQISHTAQLKADGPTSPVRLEAGAEADITADRVIKNIKPDIERAVAWRERNLVFHGDRLDRVVREFNRYNRVPIRLDGTTVAERRISGIFDADDPRPLVDFLARQPDFSVTETTEEIVIRPR